METKKIPITATLEGKKVKMNLVIPVGGGLYEFEIDGERLVVESESNTDTVSLVWDGCEFYCKMI